MKWGGLAGRRTRFSPNLARPRIFTPPGLSGTQNFYSTGLFWHTKFLLHRAFLAKRRFCPKRPPFLGLQGATHEGCPGQDATAVRVKSEGALGQNATPIAIRTSSIAIHAYSIATHTSSIAIHAYSIATHTSSIAIHTYSIAAHASSHTSSTAIHTHSIAIHTYSIAIRTYSMADSMAAPDHRPITRYTPTGLKSSIFTPPGLGDRAGPKGERNKIHYAIL